MKRFFVLGLLMTLAAVISHMLTKELLGGGARDGGNVVRHGVVIDTITYVDTVTYLMPVKSAERENGTTDVKVSASALDSALVDTTWRDSVILEIPSKQSVYGDSTYMAWVSGVNAKLDSIYVFPRNEVVTIRCPPKRWHVGLMAGYGVGKHGASPYVGVGVTYSLFSFGGRKKWRQ